MYMCVCVYTLTDVYSLHKFEILSIKFILHFLYRGDIFVEASSPDDPSKYPFLDDFKKMCPGKNPEDGIMMQMSEFVPDPRIIKTHLPLSLFSPSLLDTCKVFWSVGCVLILLDLL